MTGGGASTRGKSRVLDVLGATAGLVGFAPLLCVAGAAIRAEDGGSVLFTQERVGRGGRPFRIFKLRTMHDGRVTRTGRWLRRTGLDELPQFLNVLRGEMSIVGPRPLTAADLERLGWADDAVRAGLVPGITGPAQVFGVGPEASRSLDHRYAREASFAVDLELIGVSLAINVFGKDRVRARLRGHRYAAG